MVGMGQRFQDSHKSMACDRERLCKVKESASGRSDCWRCFTVENRIVFAQETVQRLVYAFDISSKQDTTSFQGAA